MAQPSFVPDLAARPRRRDVLFLGAGLALAPAAAWAGRERRERLAIGYCHGAAPEGGAPGILRVEAATRLGAGDPMLADGARVTIHGLLGETAGLARLGIRSADLLVGFPAAGDAPDLEVHAWSHQLLPVENAGTDVAFTVPVGRGGLALALELETLGRERFEAVLSTGREPGAPKLRAGRYLIAPGASRFTARRFDPAAGETFLSLSVEPLAA